MNAGRWDHDATAHKVAEAAAEAWYHHGHDSAGYDTVCLGTVAALALTGRGPSKVLDPARELLALKDDMIVRVITEVWALFSLSRPELMLRARRFAEWLDDEDRLADRTRGAAAVARAAVKAGIFRIAHDDDARLSVDMLGPVYMGAKSSKARAANGEFYTPPNVTTLMAAMILDSKPVEPGQTICDPCVGSGGMFRGAAAVMRERGMDPGDYWWVGADVNPVAIAMLAVNASVWGLGRRVLFGVADTLAEPDFTQRFADEQDRAREQAAELAGHARMLAAIAAMQRLLDPEPEPAQEVAALPCPQPERPPMPARGDQDTLF